TGVQTTFTVNAAGSFPTCEHSACIPCGNPHASCAGIPGCEVAGNPNGCVPRGTQGCCDQPGFIVPTFFVNILGGLCSRVDQIDLKAEPTSAGASGAFVDMNGDGCRRAGSGFIAPTNADTDGPITVPGGAAGPLRPQSYDGTVGPVTGAVSEVFSGPNSPIRD